jgi:alpha-mannosidase
MLSPRDREWYQSHEKFRRVLVHILDDIFRLFRTDMNFTHFHADGQMVVVEDYLEIRPEMLSQVMEAGRKNLLSLGPWYGAIGMRE